MSHFDSIEHITSDLPDSPKGQWQNWSANQKSLPNEVFQPVSTSELASFLKNYTGKLRVVGSGHSFSPLVNTCDTLVSLNQMTGLIGQDNDLQTARVMAGTPLHKLGPLLESIDQGMINLGDIDHQSIAGATATGTHGTGASLPCLSDLVKSMTLITLDGSVIECSSAHNKSLFNAARVNLGLLGIVSEIELKNRPCYQLKESIKVIPLKDALANIEQWKHDYRHVELFAFGYSDQVILKTLEITDEAPRQPKAPWISDDALLEFFCKATQKLPKLTPLVHKQIARFVKSSQRVDTSYKVFATPRTVRFTEMEYQVPAEHGPECLDKVIHQIRKNRLPALFPIEYRYVASDEIWLSPFYQRDSASISVHQYHQQPHWPLFNALEPIFDEYQGRPHWGKLHTKTGEQLATLYPQWNDFEEIRKEFDPKAQLLNPSLASIFGAEKST
ncbi:D-arabinono-1,4-lactone oxidase [Litoribacillus peritrichatus]